MLQFPVRANRMISLLVISLFMVPAGYAAMFKWTDEEGNIVYSQNPPPGDIQAETIKPPPKVDTEDAVKQLEMQKKKDSDAMGEKQKATKEKSEEEEKLAKQKEYCEKNKARLASLERPRVNMVGKDGERTVMGDEERQAELARVSEKIRELCK